MPTKKIKTPVIPGNTYHIYNRGNNYQNVFLMDEDYHLFLNKIKLYLTDYCAIFAFALLPNHYHLLLRLNDEMEETKFSLQFTKFILSYTNKVNFRERRNGSLFLSNFRRIKIDDENYLRRLVYYINHNPTKHGVVEDYRSYDFCSYKILISEKPTSLSRDEVISWFGERKDFIDYHNYLHDQESYHNLTFEND
jgi:REP element-mobilizing transposase RayT